MFFKNEPVSNDALRDNVCQINIKNKHHFLMKITHEKIMN